MLIYSSESVCSSCLLRNIKSVGVSIFDWHPIHERYMQIYNFICEESDIFPFKFLKNRTEAYIFIKEHHSRF